MANNYYQSHRKESLLATKKWHQSHPEYIVFKGMKSRCTNPRSSSWPYYGARGIKVKYKNYREFIDDIGNRPAKGLSVDRIDSSRDYEPGNCRWATPKQQANNRKPYKQFPHPRAKATLATIILIRKLRKEGERSSHLAKRFGLSHSAVNAIVGYRTWKEA